MRLNKMTILKNNITIREVVFKDGLNLIVNTKSAGKESGNSIGKSTLSRVIDFIFMSSGEDIYHDSEFKKDIPEIVHLIDSNTITCKLDFTAINNKKHSASRLLTRSEKLCQYYIDDIKVEKSEYINFIEINIFGLTSDKPSLRNLSHKFIRNTNEKMQMTIKFLHVNTKDDAYDQLYLFLFGFDGLPLLKTKAEINNKIKKQKSYLAAYRNPHRETVLSKMIKPLKKEIKQSEESIKKFDFKGSHDGSLLQLSKIQSGISSLTIEHANQSMRITNLEMSISLLQKDVSKIVDEDLIDIYKSAGVYLNNNLKISYEQMVIFHNNVIKNKINFLTSDLYSRKDELSSINDKINALHIEESSLFKTIKEPETLKSISQLYNKMSELKENLSAIEVNLLRINSTNSLIQELEDERASVLADISKKTNSLEKNLEIFNEYFGDLTKDIYGERYIFDLSFDVIKGKCDFDISCITPNSTGGKKKGEITAFDLAYIKFIEKTGLKRPSFIIHDSIEDVDITQIREIFMAANSIKGQYIVSVLSDKFTTKLDESIVKENCILELSTKDKFFKV